MIENEFVRLKGKLQCIDVWTPATYKRYTGAEVGSYMSFILPKGKLPTRISPKIKGIENVFLATQWQHAPGGLPTAAGCGKKAVEEIRRLEGRVSRKSESRGRAYAK